MPTFPEIIQAGGVGLGAFAIWVLWKVVQDHSDVIKNHINHQTEISSKLEVAITQLTDAIKNHIKFDK